MEVGSELTIIIEYSSESLCASRNMIYRNMKLKYIVVYENNSDKLDIGHCQKRSRSRCDFEIFLHFPQYKLSGPITQLWYMLVHLN